MDQKPCTQTETTCTNSTSRFWVHFRAKAPHLRGLVTLHSALSGSPKHGMPVTLVTRQKSSDRGENIIGFSCVLIWVCLKIVYP